MMVLAPWKGKGMGRGGNKENRGGTIKGARFRRLEWPIPMGAGNGPARRVVYSSLFILRTMYLPNLQT